MSDALKDFPIPRFNITVDLEVFADPSGQIKVEVIPKDEDIEQFGEDAIIKEAEKELSIIMALTKPPKRNKRC
jgi:hypothetical protein